MSWVEVVAVILGLVCVWLAVKQNIWNWPAGLVQVVLYIYIFYGAKLYSDAILQVIYVGVQFYGWHYWLHGGKAKASAPVTTMALINIVQWCVAGIAGTALWGYFMATMTDAACPYADAFVVVFSMIAQGLMAKKKLESWRFWTAVDVVAIGVYLYKDLYLTSGLYGVFLVLTFKGYLDWRKSVVGCTKDLEQAKALS
jgi:nicotinamide mononucleotide transporter